MNVCNKKMSFFILFIFLYKFNVWKNILFCFIDKDIIDCDKISSNKKIWNFMSNFLMSLRVGGFVGYEVFKV